MCDIGCLGISLRVRSWTEMNMFEVRPGKSAKRDVSINSRGGETSMEVGVDDFWGIVEWGWSGPETKFGVLEF